MAFDFDKINNRRGTGSLKWDVGAEELPLWVADMDFQTAPSVIDALARKVQTGIFGYEVIPEEWYEAYQNWWGKHHNLAIERDWLIFCTGVVPAISCAVKRMTNTGDNVLVLTPAYNIFYNSIENHGRHVLECPLAYEEGRYHIDYVDLDKKLAHPLTTMMILCNPHNPVGKIWSREELARIGELCARHHVLVLSDEIHCDLTKPGCEYVPYASASAECANNSITCMAASKAFNLAGMQSAAVMIPEEGIRNKMERGLNSDEIAEPNSFATTAVVAALEEGESWLKELKQYLWDNRTYAAEYMKDNLPELRLIDQEATYLLWIDCSNLTEDASALCTYIREKTGLYLSSGEQYRGNGRKFMRMNVACQRAVLTDALERLYRGVRMYKNGR